MHSRFRSARLGHDLIPSMGRLLIVCTMLLLVSVAVGIRGQRAEVLGQRTEVGGQRSEVRNQPVTRSLRLPVLTGADGQIDAQGDEQLSAEAIQALLREVEARHKEANAKLKHYSYLLKRTEHQLNDEGESTKYRMHEYRVFPRRPLAVAAMLSENGVALSPEKLAKEKARANKEWQKQRDRDQRSENRGQKAEGGEQKTEVSERSEDRDQKKEAGGQKGESTKGADDKKAPWFEGMEFKVLPRERLDDREVMVLSFRPLWASSPRAGSPPDKNADKFMSGLKGQIWIDPKEKMILKFHGELTTDFSPGGLSGWLSSLKPGTQVTIENMRLPNGLMVVKLVDFSSIAKTRGPLWLPHIDRFRVVDEMSDYRPFDPEAKDLFLN
jgi:hypothetical protein